MEPKSAIISALIIAGLFTVWLGITSWIFSVLGRFQMPSEAYLIVAGLLTTFVALIAARMFVKE